MPAIDFNACGDWTESDINLYQHMDRYLDKRQFDKKKTLNSFSKVITKTRQWKPNSGTTLRVVMSVPSPHIRQFAFPRPQGEVPLTDIMQTREIYADAQLREQDFVSKAHHFYPVFRDFLKHVKADADDITEKIERYNDIFLRGMMFHMSPLIGIAKADGTVEIRPAPFWVGTGTFTEATDGKTANFIQSIVPEITGRLSVTHIESAMTIAETDYGIPFYSGSEIPKEDQGLSGKYLWSMDSEAWNQMIYDPFVQGNKTLDFNIVTGNFKGSFFGRGTTMLEEKPLRFTVDGTYHAPERAVSAPGTYNDGEPEPNPAYTKINGTAAQASPIGVAWLHGMSGYEKLQVGAPPSEFTGSEFPDAPALQWNGAVRMTKNFLIQCLDQTTGTPIWQANSFGRYIRSQATVVCGIVPAQRRFSVPIFYRRGRGPYTAA